MTLVRISPYLADAYKAVRLAALLNDPLCFGSTYEREATLPDAEWERRASSLDGQNRVGFLALNNDEFCGLVLCFRDKGQPDTAEVICMWVSPTARLNRLGSQFLETVQIWAKTVGIKTLRLLVTSCNAAGITFYKHNGFAETGKTEAYPHLSNTWEIEMSKSIVDL